MKRFIIPIAMVAVASSACGVVTAMAHITQPMGMIAWLVIGGFSFFAGYIFRGAAA